MPTSPNNLPLKPNLEVEQNLWSAGVRCLAGIDEAGRGALAGPVSAAALILPPDPRVAQHLSGVRDSKQMQSEERAFWAQEIKSLAWGWGVGFASAAEIDRLGIVPAVHLASLRALAVMGQNPDYLLIDYFILGESDLPQTALVKGDQISLSIAGASVLAKTARDALMLSLDPQFPAYGFASHKGYGTAAHRKALQRLGPCPIHRLSFQCKFPDSRS
jgi:ribonuclease HII